MNMLPNGNYWSKLHGYLTAEGEFLYWQDGDRTSNTKDGCMFTGMPVPDHPCNYAEEWRTKQKGIAA